MCITTLVYLLFVILVLLLRIPPSMGTSTVMNVQAGGDEGMSVEGALVGKMTSGGWDFG